MHVLLALALTASAAEPSAIPAPEPTVLLQTFATLFDQDEQRQADPAGYGDPEADIGFSVQRARVGLVGENEHFAYDLTDARSDANVVFPIDTLRTLAAERFIGSVSRNAYTFMGGIYSSRKVRDLLAPAIAERVVNDEVDLALLVPV